MKGSNEDFQAFLTARMYLYTLFQSLLGNEPSEELIAAIEPDFVSEAFAEMGFEERKDSFPFITLLKELALDDLKNEYMKMFIGPEELKAPPWESVYLSSDGTLFTPETLKTRKFYKSQGFIPAEYPHEPDDHIGIELDFMAKLATKALENYDSEVARDVLSASGEFLQEHMLEWTPAYFERMKEANAQFYPHVVEAMLEFIKKDYEKLVAPTEFS